MGKVFILLVSVFIFIGSLFGKQLSEIEKIEYIIGKVEKIESGKFWRNGDEHTPKKAAKHLRLKLDHWDEDDKTVDKFIEDIASKSSWSGKSYKIIFDDGKEITTKEFFENLLEDLKKVNKISSDE